MLVPVRYLGDPILRRKCKPVEKITDEIREIAQNLVDTMQAHNCVGLAAPQAGYEYRMFCTCLSDELDETGYGYIVDPKVFINPVITYFSEETVSMDDPCLSIPGFYERVVRPKTIDVVALDVDGNEFEEKGLSEWRSRCIQHEVDHLDGILFIDRLSDKLKKKHAKRIQAVEYQCRMKQAGQGLFKSI